MNIQIKNFFSVFLVIATMSLTIADDTDIINEEIPRDSNVLFVMDMSGSMNNELASDNPPSPYLYGDTRAGVLHSALRTVLNDPTLTDINVGIASFSGDTGVSRSSQVGHGISYPVSSIDATASVQLDLNIVNNAPLSGFDHQVDTVESGTITVTSYLPLAAARTTRGYIGDAIPTTWTPSGGTPIVDALYEAALYFRGNGVHLGKADPSKVRSAHPSTYQGMLYNKTAPSVTPVLQNCGRGSQPACNGTESTPCPQALETVRCDITDVACLTAASSGGYVCDAPVTNNGHSNCNLSTCSSTPGCDTSSPNVSTNPGVCYLSSAFACEAGSFDSGSCSPDTTLGACNHWNDAGICDGRDPDINIFRCSTTTTSYSCPWSVTTKTCRRMVDACQHDTYPDITTLEGTATYKSPITDECAMNSVILLSDGKPTLANTASDVVSLITPANAAGCDAGTDSGRCGNELAAFLSSNDQSSSVTGDQFITTHTIGMALHDPSAEAYLRGLAISGGGFYVSASTPASLVTALKNTLMASPRARSFSSPTYTPDPSSALSHGDFIYVPVFDKGLGPAWIGNLKKFKRVGGILEDADGNPATDASGTLIKTARDFWSSVPSTHSVKSGGAANRINPSATRSALTDNGTGPLISLAATLPNALFGSAVTTTRKQTLVKFIRGEKSDGSARHYMGDIIHSKAVHITYSGGEQVVFIGTNEGYLHAINDNAANDANAGKELFAYMPRELLKNIDTQYRNDGLDRHIYGVDGPITLHHDDSNHNRKVDGSEKAILYFGLRRGGQTYYALDVSNRLSPRLLWKKSRGDSGLADLGFTWSKPTFAKMKIGGNPEEVLIFGGGYIDDNNTLGGGAESDNGATSRGSAVYIVKASDGSVVWKGDTNYAVPAGISVLDVNKDGLADRFYFTDTGGNVWRVIFDSGVANVASSGVAVTPAPKLFAELGGSGRKFFVEPDVALFKRHGQYTISLALGSGERPKPLGSATDDHFFMLFDTGVNASAATLITKITKSMLFERSTIPVSGALSGGKKGWYKDLGGTLSGLTGEKVLSKATTYEGVVFFNTFGTKSISVTSCNVSNVNQSRLYALDLFTGRSVLDLDRDGTPGEAEDESVKYTEGEIPGAPQIIFNKPTAKDGTGCKQGDCIRTDAVDMAKTPAVPIRDNGANGLGLGTSILKVFWLDKEQ